MYRRILVPMALDHGISSETLKIATALSAPDGEIIALHVYEEPQGAANAYLDADTVAQGVADARVKMAERLAGLENVKSELVNGHTYRTIIDYAVAKDVDCIVIGSHRPGLSDYLLGSTAARVVRHAPCAVHVYRST